MPRNKTTQNLGNLDGHVLLFGGVYSNLQALQQMKAIALDLEIPPARIICTGDIIGYCAQPEACVQTIRDWGISNIAGNVEIQLREGEQDCGCDFSTDSRCDVFSRNWYTFAQREVSQSTLNWLHSLPDFIQFTFNNHSCLVVHGSYTETSEFIFKSTDWAVKEKNFALTHADLILAGHCGLPFHDSHNGKTWLNPGVIGMPANDGTARVWYALLHPQTSYPFFTHHSFTYDTACAAALMYQHNLPKDYARTLETGIWDNCDILPPTETALQGQRLVFN